MIRFILLLCLVSLARGASPIEEFRAALAEPITSELPPTYVTWDSDSKQVRDLVERDYNRVVALADTKAKEHVRFLSALVPGVKFDFEGKTYGIIRLDRNDSALVEMSARQYLEALSNDANPWVAHLTRWSKLGNKFTVQAQQSFLALNTSAAGFRSGNPTPQQKAFLQDLDAATVALNACLTASPSVDQRRFLRTFLARYAGPVK